MSLVGVDGVCDVPLGLGPRDQVSHARNPDTHLSRWSHSQGSGSHRHSGGYLWVWGGCSWIPGLFVNEFFKDLYFILLENLKEFSLLLGLSKTLKLNQKSTTYQTHNNEFKTLIKNLLTKTVKAQMFSQYNCTIVSDFLRKSIN